MVLNACRSGMLDEQAGDAFASVAASLQRAGIRSVVAMAYALYADAARVFVPAFYRRLLQAGNIEVPEAVRAGRQALLRDKQRRVGAVRQPLDDWLVPVVYQQGAEDFDFLTRSGDDDSADDNGAAGLLPPDLALIDNPYGCIGRDGALLTLERALRRPPAGILIHGLRGVGKTTLTASLLRWLAATGGLTDPVFWFDFTGLDSSRTMFDRLAARLLDIDPVSSDPRQTFERLIAVCKREPLLIVWDHSDQTSLPAADREQLKDFVYRLRGGNSKVIMTSRQSALWLNNPTYCYRLRLSGLNDEERWQLYDAILCDQGLRGERDADGLAELMQILSGHPLLMQLMLTQLDRHRAENLTALLRDLPAGFDNTLEAKLSVAQQFSADQ
jgi:hypothetical protein